MNTKMILAAVDLGAESGRVSLGRFDGERMDIEVVHRFANRPQRLVGTLHWNTVQLFAEILEGLRKARAVAGEDIVSVGIDTWGCDFGILDADGRLLGVPVHYRDQRTDGLIEEVDGIIPREQLFAASGIASWPFNTLYQLRALARQKSPLLREGRTLLFTPDLLHYWMCGVKANERAIASTSQCMGVSDDKWLADILGKLDIPAGIFSAPTVASGSVLGPVLPSVAEEIGMPGMRVIVPACHDTASAVAATPLSSPDAAYLSCGTWSLLGLESDTPVTSADALAAKLTNEKGVGKSYRILQNIMGLWLVQQSRAALAREGDTYEYADLAAMAERAEPFQAWIDPNDLRFYAPADMPAEVRRSCADSGQPVPQTVEELMRCLLESLAFTYRAAVDELERIKGIDIPCLHVIGGGAQNRVLAQWTANALGRPVVAGPVEGTTMGNLLVQAMGLGELGGLPQIRDIVRNSCEVITYEPRESDRWQQAYARYRQIILKA